MRQKKIHHLHDDTLVFEIRGYLVMLASDVAEIFEVETRLINQNIKENNKNIPSLFPEKYAFQLTDEETEFLRSSGMISKLTRGGSRANPWVITRKGTIRLTTVMKSPKAVKAADLFVDIFDEIIENIRNGNYKINLSNPSRLMPDDAAIKQLTNIREKIANSVSDLLNTVINKKDNKTVKDELGEVADDALNYLKEWLKNKRLSNDKINAETLLLIEQTRDIYERRLSELATAKIDREEKTLDIIVKKIRIIKRLLKLYNEIEPSALVNLVSGFDRKGYLLPNSEMNNDIK